MTTRRPGARGLLPGRALGLAFLGALVVAFLGPVAGSLPAEGASAAATDLTLVGAATYTVLPAEGRVHVVVDFSVRNRTSETRTTKFYFDHAFVAVLPGTTGFRVGAWKGSKVRAVKRTSTHTMLRLDFGARLYSGKTHALQLSFDLPDPGPDANRDVRIGTSLVTFPVWAFASDGAQGSTVSVRFPAGYEVAVESGKFDRQGTTDDGGTRLDAGPLERPLSFFAYVSGQRPAVYRDAPLTVGTGSEDIRLTIRAWEDDPGWPGRIEPLLKAALPILRRDVGTAWPHRDPLVVREAVSRSNGGYAALFDGGRGLIDVAYWAQPLVVLHEAAHGWFNGALLADRWASEGFASLYAGRAAAELKIEGAAPALTGETAAAAIPLNAWSADGSADRAVEAYGFAASATLAQAIAERAGDEALRRVWADAAGGVGAYQAESPAGGTAGGPAGASGPSGGSGDAAEPETVDGPPDWRGLLDLLEAETGREFTDLWRRWVVREGEAGLLDARAAARTSYARTQALADGWVLPRAVRDALRAWRFDAAEQLLADARTVLAQRVALEQVAARDGLVLPGAVRALFEAGSMREASAEADAERNAILAIRQATDARRADADPLTAIGMLGEQPEADIRAAREALAAGDLDATIASADDAYRAWNGAWQEGRRRALLALATLATVILLGSAIGGRIRRARRGRLRPPLAGAALALLLTVAAAIVSPVAGPASPLPVALDVPVVLAADDIEIATAARYVVDPGDAVIRVVVDVTAVNRKPNAVRGGTITRYFYDGVNLGVQPEAAHLRATQDGVTLSVSAAPRDGYRLVTVLFRRAIYFGERASVRLAFDLPAGKPRSASDVRVGPAFAGFIAWAFGDTGTVRIEVPAGFEAIVTGSGLERMTGTTGQQVFTASTSAPLDWYAEVSARNDDALTREEVTLAGGDRIVVRGWPEDARWRDRVASVLTRAVPDLATLIGLPWPVDGPLTVIEVHTPVLEGYAGLYDSSTDLVTIGEDLDDVTIVHEASHAWFNGGLFADRWINEGLAEEYAARVLQVEGAAPDAPGEVDRTAPPAFPLNAWPPPAAIGDRAGEARERYGYDASWAVIRAILAETGEAGLRLMFRAAAEHTTAYLGDAAPETTTLPNDWRRFLDLADELGGAKGTSALMARWVATDDAQASLAAREAALGVYRSLAAAGDGWAAPVVVRLAMDGWTFDRADDAMRRAEAVLGQRGALRALAAEEQLVPPEDLESAYEGASTPAQLDEALALAVGTTASLEDVAVAGDAAAEPRDWLTSLGLDGQQPDADLAAARAAWQAGDRQRASVLAGETADALAAAPGRGRARVLVVGGGATGVVVVLGVAIVMRRNRRPGPGVGDEPAAGPGPGAGPAPADPGEPDHPGEPDDPGDPGV